MFDADPVTFAIYCFNLLTFTVDIDRHSILPLTDIQFWERPPFPDLCRQVPPICPRPWLLLTTFCLKLCIQFDLLLLPTFCLKLCIQFDLLLLPTFCLKLCIQFDLLLLPTFCLKLCIQFDLLLLPTFCLKLCIQFNRLRRSATHISWPELLV